MHATGGIRVSARRLGMIAPLAVIAGLTGCATSGGSVVPLPYASAEKQARPAAGSEQLLAALHGGLLPAASLQHLSRSDRLRALEAEYKALESAPGGLPVEWKSFDGRAAGRVTAATPYQVGQQNCRQYTHTATIDGRSVTGQGAACRDSDGSWTPLS